MESFEKQNTSSRPLHLSISKEQLLTFISSSFMLVKSVSSLLKSITNIVCYMLSNLHKVPFCHCLYQCAHFMWKPLYYNLLGSDLCILNIFPVSDIKYTFHFSQLYSYIIIQPMEWYAVYAWSQTQNSLHKSSRQSILTT